MSMDLTIRIYDQDDQDIELVQEEIVLVLRQAGFTVAPKGVSLLLSEGIKSDD